MPTRFMEQWGITLMLLFLMTGGCDHPPRETQVRIALFIGAAHLLYRERKRLRHVFRVLGERLKRAGLETRPRWSQRTFTFTLALGLYLGWGALLVVLSPTMRRILDDSSLAPMGKLFALGLVAASWATVSVMWGDVVRDRVSLWRRTASAWRAERAELKRAQAEAHHRAEAARLSGEEGPEPPPPPPPSTIPLRPPPEVMPSYVAVSTGVALFFALLGFPSARTMVRTGTFAVQLAEVMAKRSARAAPSGSVELFLELGADDEIGEVVPILLRYGARPRRAFPEISLLEHADLGATWVLTVDRVRSDALKQALLADRENVDHVELNSAIDFDPSALAARCVPGSASLPTNDPLASAQRELKAIGAETAMRALKAGTGERRVRVGVVDSGVDGAHEDLLGVLSSRSPSGDPRGHGTQVAGVLAGRADNGRGIASLNLNGALIELASYPAFLRTGTREDDIVTHIWDAIEDGVRILNLSFSQPLEQGAPPRYVEEAIEEALAHGIIVVASAGNAPRRDAREVWPASIPGVIVVASADSIGRLSDHSSSVAGVRRAVVAPGEGVCTTASGGGYVSVTGTSFAAPMVSGSLALAAALCPGLDADGAWQVLSRSDPRRGFGQPVRLRVDQILRQILQEGCP